MQRDHGIYCYKINIFFLYRHCERCKCDRQAAKNIELWKLPPVLVVQFKRYVKYFALILSFPVTDYNTEMIFKFTLKLYETLTCKPCLVTKELVL